MGELCDRGQISTAQQWVTGVVHDHSRERQSFEVGVRFSEITALHQLAAMEHHLRLLEHIDAGESPVAGSGDRAATLESPSAQHGALPSLPYAG